MRTISSPTTCLPKVWSPGFLTSTLAKIAHVRRVFEPNNIEKIGLKRLLPDQLDPCSLFTLTYVAQLTRIRRKNTFLLSLMIFLNIRGYISFLTRAMHLFHLKHS